MGEMIKAMSVDPGVTTGYTVAHIQEKVSCSYTPYQKILDVEDYWDLLDLVKPRIIVIEDFEFRQKARAGLNLFPVQLIGVTHLYAAKCGHQCGVVVQKAAQGKGYYTDNILKQHNLYIRGLPHGMDASRHLLHWLTFGSGFQYAEGAKQGEFFELVPA